MNEVRYFLRWSTLMAMLFAFCPSQASAINLEKLDQNDIQSLKKITAKLEPIVKERRRNANLVTLTFDDLYQPLDARQKSFLDQFKMLDANALNLKVPYRGIAMGKADFVKIKGQQIKKYGKVEHLPPQFLPKHVCEPLMAMMSAMQKDIGKRLYVESGYRSSAYQLYLFINSMKGHNFSIRETAQFVALPGFSEHGDYEHTAVDFINENGVNNDNARAFEGLAEYRWLLANAGKFGFVLSYPRGSKEGITFEPWHWRYEGTAAK